MDKRNVIKQNTLSSTQEVLYQREFQKQIVRQDIARKAFKVKMNN